MKKKSKKTLAEKVQEKLDYLSKSSADEAGPAIGVEAQKNLEKALNSYLDACAHLAGTKKEHQIAKGHQGVAASELRLAHKQVKKLMKQSPISQKAMKRKQKKKAD